MINVLGTKKSQATGPCIKIHEHTGTHEEGFPSKEEEDDGGLEDGTRPDRPAV